MGRLPPVWREIDYKKEGGGGPLVGRGAGGTDGDERSRPRLRPIVERDGWFRFVYDMFKHRSFFSPLDLHFLQAMSPDGSEGGDAVFAVVD